MPKLISGVYMLFGNDGCVFGVVPHNDSHEIGGRARSSAMNFHSVSTTIRDLHERNICVPGMVKDWRIPLWPKPLVSQPNFTGESEETRHASNDSNYIDTRHLQALDFCSGLFDIQKSFPSGMMFYLVSRSIEMDYQEAGVMEDPCMIQF